MVTSKTKKNISIVSLVVSGIALIAGFTFCMLKVWTRGDDTEKSQNETLSTEEPETAEEEEKLLVTEVDFQPVVDKWVKTVGGTKSVYIYDLNLDKVVGSYNVEADYNTASLYKLFVVYEGYKRINNGDWDGAEKAGATGYTVNECLDLAIRESNSECAEVLLGLIGRSNLTKIIEEEWGIVNSNIMGLISNVADISAMMKRFYRHPDFNDETLLNNMWDSFLNQPTTTYNWRQGLPSGFSKATAYNKVGWDFDPDEEYWKIYHDTAIVKFPMEDGTTRDFVVTVMSNKVDFRYIRNFAKMLEEAFYSF